MKKIFKYELKVTEEQIIHLPENAKILSCQFQSDVLCLWALFDTRTRFKQPRKIRIIGTGNPIYDSEVLVFISTVQKGLFVWHVFEDHI